MKPYCCLLLSLLLLAVGNAAPGFVDDSWHDDDRDRDVPLRIRMPAGEGPFPVLLISHGLGGSRRGLGYLAEAARDAGWIAINLQHPGSDETLWKGKRGLQVLPQLKAAIRNPQPALDRLADVSFVIDELLQRHKIEGKFHQQVRADRIAIAGHSFGAWTVYAAVGRRSANARRLEKRRATPTVDSRVRAIIALSPQGEATRAVETAAVADVKVPTLNVTGGNDTSPIQRDMTAERRRYSFDTLPDTARPSYLLWFDDADHMVFGGNERERRVLGRKGRYDKQVQTIVATASVAFLQREVLGDKTADLLVDEDKSKALMDGLGIVERKLPPQP